MSIESVQNMYKRYGRRLLIIPDSLSSQLANVDL